MDRLWRVVVSVRTTVVLLAAIAVMLLLRVALPQAEGPSAAAYADLVQRSRAARFVLVTLELGDVATSRIFYLALVLFFLNLAAVLGERAGTTFRRIRFRAPTADAVRNLARGAEALESPRPEGFAPDAALLLLRRLGYRTARPDGASVWGVKHRTAPLGFLVFHASFFVLCAGAILLYLTRSVAVMVATEGQETDTAKASLVRRAPWGVPEPFAFTASDVRVAVEEGKPVHLSARIKPADPGEPAQTSRVNHPATWGPLTVLVERAGLAPVLWLQDGRGFTLDRVAVVVSGQGDAVPVPLAGGALEARVEPVPVGSRFPPRDALGRFPLSVRVAEGGREVFRGELVPGQLARVGDRWLALQELRYWVGLRLVHERGGPLLVLGFCAGVAGLVWRLLWFRREVAIVWDERTIRVAGRGELFPARFRDELESIRDLLLSNPGARP